MRVKMDLMISIPYSIEINEIPAILELKLSAEVFGPTICDQFDVLSEDGAKTGRVMATRLHPFLIGHPYRSKYFDKALAHIDMSSHPPRPASPQYGFLLAGFAGGNVRGSGGRQSFRLRSADGIGPVLKLACHGVLPKFAQGLSVTIQRVR
jgi:hypothetical protein